MRDRGRSVQGRTGPRLGPDQQQRVPVPPLRKPAMRTPVPCSETVRCSRIAAITVLAALAGALLVPRSARVAADQGPRPAKSVIQIWMWGGPSHLDTFDPKPDAGAAYTGPLNTTQVDERPGHRDRPALPRLARQADKYAIVRSMTHGINSHETAAYLMQTGNAPGSGAVFPSARGDRLATSRDTVPGTRARFLRTWS